MAGGSYDGSIRLNKVFYDAHLFYWHHFGKYLTSHPIVRLPHGPAIHDWRALAEELVAEGSIEIGKRPRGPYNEDVFNLRNGQPSPPLTPEEAEAIENALAWVADKSAVEISRESHLRSRTWREAENGEELHAVLDSLTEMEHSRIQDRLRTLAL